MNTNAAIIGLGLIGSCWAKNLDSDGVLCASWNRSPKADLPKFNSDLIAVVKGAQIVHVCVSDEIVVKEVVAKIVSVATPDHTVIQSTTIDPNTSDLLKSSVEKKGAKYIEAPFTGSLPAAQDRKTVFYLGGDSAIVDQCMPYLKRLSHKQFHIGSNRQACTLKLAMNLQIASIVEALAEALTISREAKIPDDLFFSVFKENASYSGVAGLKEPKLKANDFSPQFSVKHMAKDMRLLAEHVGEARYASLQTIRDVLAKAEREGLADEDFSSVIQLLKAKP